MHCLGFDNVGYRRTGNVGCELEALFGATDRPRFRGNLHGLKPTEWTRTMNTLDTVIPEIANCL